MADRILVRFTGEDDGEAELTWGQQQIWGWLATARESMNMCAIRPLSGGETVDMFVDELRFFMARFQAMRTRLRFDGDTPRQVVARSGEVALEIVDAADGVDPAGRADAVAAEHRHRHFDYAGEWPVRMTLIRQAGSLTHLVVTLCHAVLDSAAAMVMFSDLLSRDPVTGTARAPVAAGPLELAAGQRSPAGGRQTHAARRYWERHQRVSPTRRPAMTPAPDGRRYWRMVFESPALYLALRRLTGRLATESATILLAAYALALARSGRGHPVVLQVMVGNRFRPGLADMVGPVNQPGLCVLDITETTTFDDAVALARRRVITTYKYAYYDHAGLNRLIARIEDERGAKIDLACYLNDRRMQTTMEDERPLPTEAEMAAAVARGVLCPEPIPFFIRKFMLTVDDATDAVALVVEGDATYASEATAAALVRGIEALAVAAAVEPSRSVATPAA
jgi:hypothetical protein